MSHRRRPSAQLVSLGRTLAFVALASAFAGCSLLAPTNAPPPPPTVAVPTQPDPNAPRLAALETRRFTLGAGQDLVGETQVLFARYENTFSAIGREYDLGYEEMRQREPRCRSVAAGRRHADLSADPVDSSGRRAQRAS